MACSIVHPIIDARRHDAVLFDLDGVVTDTATVHAQTWAQMFDEFLRRRAEQVDEDHSAFTQADYLCHVDGKSRVDGIRDFLASRGIVLRDGRHDDADTVDTVYGLANRKQGLFEDRLRMGITPIESTVGLVRRLDAAGIGAAIYSSSMNCSAVLRSAGLDDLFGVQVDGHVAEQLGLRGKPDPAVLLETARRLVARPDRCVIIEDARAGVIAGHDGGFGMVIGLGPRDRLEDLLACGADVAVTDLAEVSVTPLPRATVRPSRTAGELPPHPSRPVPGRPG